MPASFPPNFLNPKYARKFIRRFGLALLEHISAGIESEGLHKSAAINRKVRAAIEQFEGKTFISRNVQYHPRALNRKEICILWRSSCRDSFSPPDELFTAEEKQWKATSGKVEVDALCHLKAIARYDTIRSLTKQSEPFTGWFCLDTKLIDIVEHDGHGFGRWTVLPPIAGPFCSSAMYRRSRSGIKRLIAVPVAQHWLSKDDADWKALLEEELRFLHSFAAEQEAELEIYCPKAPDKFWPQYTERYI